MSDFSQTGNDFEFERSDYGSIVDFFNDAAEDYDSDLENPYFSFSHEILKFILTKHIREHFHGRKNIRLLDAGAGTGNWSKYVLGLNESIQGTLFDMNPKMLQIARQKLGSLRGIGTKIIEGNLENPGDFPPEKSDMILCLHNVIGMGRNISLILSNIYSHLEDNGLAFIMTSNKYQAFDFTRKYRNFQEALRVVRDGSVKYKDDMPEMFCFTPAEFHGLLSNAGFDNITVLGYPVTIHPQKGDEQLMQKRTSQSLLKDKQTRAQLLSLEKQLCLNPELAYRAGSSLIAVCIK
jgi:SAM-dependent methyltransferase